MYHCFFERNDNQPSPPVAINGDTARLFAGPSFSKCLISLHLPKLGGAPWWLPPNLRPTIPGRGHYPTRRCLVARLQSNARLGQTIPRVPTRRQVDRTADSGTHHLGTRWQHRAQTTWNFRWRRPATEALLLLPERSQQAHQGDQADALSTVPEPPHRARLWLPTPRGSAGPTMRSAAAWHGGSIAGCHSPG